MGNEMSTSNGMKIAAKPALNQDKVINIPIFKATHENLKVINIGTLAKVVQGEIARDTTIFDVFPTNDDSCGQEMADVLIGRKPSEISLSEKESQIPPRQDSIWTEALMSETPFILPLKKGIKNLDVITGDTLVQLLNREIPLETVVVDCRFPYEFEAGHIRGAINIQFAEDLERVFFPKVQGLEKCVCANVLVFHCEFSRVRAPAMYKYLEEMDRSLNLYPMVCLLEGGYSNFFRHYREYCEPQGYLKMWNKSHYEDMHFYESKRKEEIVRRQAMAYLRENNLTMENAKEANFFK